MKVNVAVNIKEFSELKQDAGEPVRQYQARLQGKALSCDFHLKMNQKCVHCNKEYELSIGYMEEMIRHKVVTGLADPDILQDILASEKKTLEETVLFVEGKESGKQNKSHLTTSNLRSVYVNTKRAYSSFTV